MNTFKNIILVLHILFIGCGENPLFIKCDWANVIIDDYTHHYYTGAEPEESIESVSTMSFSDSRCIYIHYYEDGNYMIYAEHSDNFNNDASVYTIDLDTAVDFEYEEK